MISSDFTRPLLVPDSASKIILLVIDGLSGLPHSESGVTELDAAHLPQLDELAANGACGLLSPLGPGFTPGSGPAHLALFGYDPWHNEIGRGALSAMGLGLDFKTGDVAARLNFCTVDDAGRVSDRRAGRIATAKTRELCALLQDVKVAGAELTLAAEMDYRAAIVFRGDQLGDDVDDSDPQVTGVPPRAVNARSDGSEKTAAAARSFLTQVAQRLRGQEPANMTLIRGFGRYPDLPQFADVYGLRALAIAGYPMYRGVAAAVGMSAVATAPDLASECELLQKHWNDYDFFYVHVKKTDSAGEDGDFDRKVSLLEEVDAQIPHLRALNPDVLIVTGDHSTPSVMRSHSWHPVPVLIDGPFAMPGSDSCTFSERGCRGGTLGTIPSSSLMALVLAHAGRLSKFGA